MIGLNCLGNPHNGLRALNASEVSENLAEMIVICPTKLVFYDYPMFSLIRGTSEDVGEERSDSLLDRFNLEFHIQRLA